MESYTTHVYNASEGIDDLVNGSYSFICSDDNNDNNGAGDHNELIEMD